MATQSKAINLSSLFQAVTNTMAENRDSLNQADDYNHNHGDNMVEIFDVITQAMKEKKNATPADQLAYASQILRQKSNTGSAQLYAQNLNEASSLFTGQKKLTVDDAMRLVQALLGSGQQTSTSAPAAGGEVLGSLLGGLTGQQTSGSAPAAGGDVLGSLLGGLTGQTSQGGNQPGLDMNDLLNAGMAFMQAKQSGSSNMDAILNAVVSGSKMGSSAHRSQSGTLVANTLIQVLSQLGQK